LASYWKERKKVHIIDVTVSSCSGICIKKIVLNNRVPEAGIANVFLVNLTF
jgi:hypothetical protein